MCNYFRLELHIHCKYILNLVLAEKLWPLVYHRSNLHFDDNMGGRARVSQSHTRVLVFHS